MVIGLLCLMLVAGVVSYAAKRIGWTAALRLEVALIAFVVGGWWALIWPGGGGAVALIAWIFGGAMTVAGLRNAAAYRSDRQTYAVRR